MEKLHSLISVYEEPLELSIKLKHQFHLIVFIESNKTTTTKKNLKDLLNWNFIYSFILLARHSTNLKKNVVLKNRKKVRGLLLYVCCISYNVPDIFQEI